MDLTRIKVIHPDLSLDISAHEAFLWLERYLADGDFDWLERHELAIIILEGLRASVVAEGNPQEEA